MGETVNPERAAEKNAIFFLGLKTDAGRGFKIGAVKGNVFHTLIRFTVLYQGREHLVRKPTRGLVGSVIGQSFLESVDATIDKVGSRSPVSLPGGSFFERDDASRMQEAVRAMSVGRSIPRMCYVLVEVCCNSNLKDLGPAA